MKQQIITKLTIDYIKETNNTLIHNLSINVTALKGNKYIPYKCRSGFSFLALLLEGQSRYIKFSLMLIRLKYLGQQRIVCNKNLFDDFWLVSSVRQNILFLCTIVCVNI